MFSWKSRGCAHGCYHRACQRRNLVAPRPGIFESVLSRQATLSIRLIWPFARLAVSSGGSFEALEEIRKKIGLDSGSFGNPDTRIPHQAVMDTLEATVRVAGDPTIGLRAGASVEPGDFDVVEYAARSMPTLGEAMMCFARYFRILNDAAQITVDIEGEHAVWRIRIVDGVPQPPAANDFALASGLAFAKRNVESYEAPREIWLMHDRPSYAAAYEAFEAPVKFGAPYNAMFIRKERMNQPMLRANPKISVAFEAHARHVLEGLQKSDGVSGRVREEVARQLRTGLVNMRETARRLAMSTATLRRRLEEEESTFSDIVDDVRRRLADQYLGDPALTVTEIAFLLGFSDLAAFDRAFKRWTGLSPTVHRAQRRESRPPPA
jgi:AraC-like DNA-binding protein